MLVKQINRGWCPFPSHRMSGSSTGQACTGPGKRIDLQRLQVGVCTAVGYEAAAGKVIFLRESSLERAQNMVEN